MLVYIFYPVTSLGSSRLRAASLNITIFARSMSD